MKYFIVLIALIGATLAASPRGGGGFQQQVSHGQEIPILKSTFDIHEDGSYGYEYETGNGISAGENGVGGQYAKGHADWTAPDGEHVFFQYTADENGYQPSGSHVPQVPEYITRAIEWIRTHPNPEYQHY